MNDYYVVAVSHIDMAFTMREEAHEEMLEIMLERVIGVLERHPELHFALEQAAHYRKLESRRPDLFEKVKKLLQSGRMEFLGGMATTAELNFPNGECLVRNQGMGYMWVEKNLGVKPQIGWLVDTFGLNAQIPQIMRQFGFKHAYASRFGGDKRYDMFLDEGLDGSRILIMGKDGYSLNILPDSQAFVFCRNYEDVDNLYAEADALRGSVPKMVNYYIENEEMFSEYYLKLTEERGWKHSSYQEYSDVLEKHGYDVPVLSGDLNPEFTGTFALRTPIKVQNRKTETQLLEAELWDALLPDKAKETKTMLEECWWDIFFCQFHDVFTGSHEDITYQNVMKKYSRIQNLSDTVMKTALQLKKKENTVVCCNSLPWKRKEWVETGDRKFLAEMQPCSIREYNLSETDQIEAEKVTRGREIFNEHFRLVLSERDGIARLEDKYGNVYIKDAGDFLVAQADFGGLQIEQCNGAEYYALTGKVTIGSVHTDETGQSITMYGEFPAMGWNQGKNRLTWKTVFSLRRGEKGLRVKLELDWEGQETRIRFRIPCAVEGRDVYHEIPFGVVRRETYRNRPTAKGEWPAMRFAALENGRRGIALINRGVAGVEQEGRALTTTLIRAYGEKDNPWIKPSELTSQNGKSEYDFMVVPYEGSYKDAGIIRIAQEFNQPVRVMAGSCAKEYTDGSWFSVDQKNIVLSAIKCAWDGTEDLVVRMYEAAGEKEFARVKIKDLQAVYQSDVKEEKGEELEHHGDIIKLEFEPFEIKTICIKRK